MSEPTLDHPDVRVIDVDGRRVILVGTAHVSRESADLVRRVIEEQEPDTVCVELDAQRHKALIEGQRWEKLDLKQVIRNKQLPTLLVNLFLASYQKRMAGKLGVMPGMELMEAAKVAEEKGIPVRLCDREIRITLRRAARSMGFVAKMKLMSAMLAGLFETPELSEEELRELRKQDVLSEMMKELATAMPALKRVLIDERDTYLAEKIRTSEGAKIVAVVGAGHVEGIVEALEQPGGADLAAIETIPKAAPVGKIIGWGVPVLIVGSLIAIAWTKGGEMAGKNLLVWVLANGVPSALGAAIALGHPGTVIATFFAAPITSLNPTIGAGYVAAFVQAWFRPPLVRDFQLLGEEFGQFPRKWWSNHLLRILLVFILATLGSLLGTFVGGYKIFESLIGS